MDEKETPRDDTWLKLGDESGMTRRDLIRRGAVVGGTLLWVAPAIQSIGSKAYAQTGSPLCDACVAITFGGSTVHFNVVANAACCDCLAAAAGPPVDVFAVFACVVGGPCANTGVEDGPCE